MKTCQACGVVIERTHGRAIYCEPCASEGRRQRNRRRGNLGRVAAPYARSQRVLSPKAMTVGETNAGRELYPEMPGVDYQRPRTRAECFLWRIPCKTCLGTGDCLDRSNGTNRGETDGLVPPWNEGERKGHDPDVDVPVRVRKKGGRRGTEPSSEPGSLVRLPGSQAQRLHGAKEPTDTRVLRVDIDDQALHQSQMRELGALRRQGNQGVPEVDGGSELSNRHGAPSISASLAGSDRQQRRLHSEKLPLGDSKAAGSKQAKQPCPDCGGTGLAHVRMGEKDGAFEVYNQGAYQAWLDARERGEDTREPLAPCVFAGCRHHLFLDVKESGAIVFNFWGKEPDEMAESCSLDVADRGGLELTEVAAALGLTREAARVIELRAAAKVRAAKPWLRADVEGDRVRLVVLPTDDDTDTDDMPEAAE